jgi:hypothetical protein
MVVIEPLPLAFRDVPRLYWPGHPPIRPSGETPEPGDRELARALYLALDPDSQIWWSGLRPWIGLPPLEQDE